MDPTWKGWALGDRALYIQRPAGSQYVRLYLQHQDEVVEVGIFADTDAAIAAQQFLEDAIEQVGVANLELTAALTRSA